MKKKSVGILIASILLIGTVVFLWWAHRGSGGDAVEETFQTTGNKLMDLKKDLHSLMHQSVKYEIDHIYINAVGKYKEYEILNCVRKTLKKFKLPIDTFSMDGAKMDDPILKMYHKNPEVFKVLGKCGFLELIGRIVAMAAWTTNAKAGKGNSESDLNKFVKCMDGIKWTDIKVWKEISSPEGAVMKCVQGS